MDLAGKSPVQLRNCRICANHFPEQCFNSDLKHRLTRYAVPTLVDSSINCKVPRLDDYSLTLNNKISKAFLDERTNAASMKKKANGWEDCNISDTIVPFAHNGGNTSHKVPFASSKTSQSPVVYNEIIELETEAEESSSLNTKSHPSPEPFPASLFCEVSYGADNETEEINNAPWRNSTFPEFRPNPESETVFPVPPLCSVSNNLDNKTEVCCNMRQKACMITDTHPHEETGKPFPVSLFSTINNLENDTEINNRIREQLPLIPDFHQCPENGKPFPISLYRTANNNLDCETEMSNITGERNSSIPPLNRKRKHVLAKSLLTQYINFLKERDIAKQKRHEEKMEELRKNNELLTRILMAIEKE